MNYKRKFTYSKSDVDCKLCTEYRHKEACPHAICPYIAERIEAGAVTYADAVAALIPSSRTLGPRLSQLVTGYSGSFFLDSEHKSRMILSNARLGFVPRRNTPSYYAVLYLLTANKILYWRTANCFCHYGMDWEYAILSGINVHNYTLYRAALGLTTDRRGVTLSEMADRELVDDAAFRLIINAMLIAKYGVAAMKLKKEVCGDDK